MNFEELQKEWESMKIEPKSHDELRDMMYNNSHAWHTRSMSPRVMRRFILSVSVALIVSPILDLFSLYTPPVRVALNQIEDQYLALRYLRLIPDKGKLPSKVAAGISKMKLVLFVARFIHACVWLALAVIVITSLAMGPLRIADVIWLSLLVLLVGWRSSRRWSKRVKGINAMLKELNEESELAVGK